MDIALDLISYKNESIILLRPSLLIGSLTFVVFAFSSLDLRFFCFFIVLIRVVSDHKVRILFHLYMRCFRTQLLPDYVDCEANEDR